MAAAFARLRAWLNRRFKLEEINGGERCPTYLYRWTLGKFGKRASVYLHWFVRDDWSRDLHDHPKRFISIGLWGAYREHTFRPGAQHCPCSNESEHTVTRDFRAPWIRSFPADHTHRLSLIDGRPCLTLVIVLSASRPWGFWHRGEWIPWRQYVNSSAADDARDC